MLSIDYKVKVHSAIAVQLFIWVITPSSGTRNTLQVLGLSGYFGKM